MKFPILCHSCGNESTVKQSTLAKALEPGVSMACKKCGSADIDFDDTRGEKNASNQSGGSIQPTAEQWHEWNGVTTDLNQGRADSYAQTPQQRANNRPERLQEAAADGEPIVVGDILDEMSRSGQPQIGQTGSRHQAGRPVSDTDYRLYNEDGSEFTQDQYSGFGKALHESHPNPWSTCLNCETRNPPGATHCSRCGEGRWAFDASRRTRRQATIVDVDASLGLIYLSDGRIVTHAAFITDQPMDRLDPDPPAEEVQRRIMTTPPSPYADPAAMPEGTTQPAHIAPSMDNGEKHNSAPQGYDGRGTVSARSKIAQIASDVMATNPGLPHTTAFKVAERTVRAANGEHYA